MPQTKSLIICFWNPVFLVFGVCPISFFNVNDFQWLKSEFNYIEITFLSHKVGLTLLYE